MNPDAGPRCPECRLGLGTHDARDPQCIDYTAGITITELQEDEE